MASTTATTNQTAAAAGAANRAASAAATSFSGVADAFVAAMNAGFDAQNQAMHAWTRAFGMSTPEMGDVRQRTAAFATEAADMVGKNTREMAAFAGEFMGVTAGFFGKSVETLMGVNAPTTPEATTETIQKLTREATEITRAAAERSAQMGVRQTEAVQGLMTDAWGAAVNGRKSRNGSR